jgi:hypothetical protein
MRGFRAIFRGNITDNLNKAGWSWGRISAFDPNGRQFGLLPRIATIESVLLRVPMKS